MILARVPAWLRVSAPRPDRLRSRLRFETLLYAALAGCTLCSLTVPALARAADPDSYLAYDGEARSTDGTTILYREHHVLRSHDGTLAERVVTYACPDGRPFARKLLDYASSPLAPDLKFEDARSGSQQSLDTLQGARRLLARDSAKARPVDVVIPASASLVADAGFDEFIQRSWPKLLTDAAVGFDILLLSDGSVLHLKATHVRHTQVAAEDVDVFRVALSGLLGLIAPEIDVTYASSDHVLRRFEGISNIRDESGRQVRTVIDFPRGERRRVSAQVWNDAVNAPLVSRCSR